MECGTAVQLVPVFDAPVAEKVFTLRKSILILRVKTAVRIYIRARIVGSLTRAHGGNVPSRFRKEFLRRMRETPAHFSIPRFLLSAPLNLTLLRHKMRAELLTRFSRNKTAEERIAERPLLDDCYIGWNGGSIEINHFQQFCFF